MITPEQLAQRLEAEGHETHSGLYCTEEGLAALCFTTDRTVRRWRVAGKAPPHTHLSKILFDLERVAEWMNSGGLDSVKKPAAVSESVHGCPSATPAVR